MSFIIGKTVSKTFLDRVNKTPHRIGFEYKVNSDWKQITFRQFYEQARRLSFGLTGLSVQPGEKVALLSSTRYEWSLMDMAILGARGVTVPIDPSITADDVAYILEHAEAVVAILEDVVQFRKLQRILYKQKEDRNRLPHLRKIVLIDNSASSEVLNAPELSKNILTFEVLQEIGRREEAKNPKLFDQNLLAAHPDDLMTICYTSGTTGIPKGVMLTHDNMMSVLEDCVTIFSNKIQPNQEVVLSFLPFSHILGKFESMAVYTFGWKQVFAESIDNLPKNFGEVRPTIIFAVPRVFERAYDRIQEQLLAMPKRVQKLFSEVVDAGQPRLNLKTIRKLTQVPTFSEILKHQIFDRLVFSRIREGFGGRLKFAVCGGAPLSEKVGKLFDAIGIRILEGYGLTETCAPVTLNSLDRPKYNSVGRPLPEVSLKIAEDGEILVRSRKLFKGYYKMPEETAAVMQKGWFHTGDIGFLDQEGMLHITDRKKDLIVTSGGKNIAPQKIENMVKSYKLISQFVVYGDRRNYLTALVSLDRQQAIAFANENQILFSQYSELIKHPKIRAKVQQILDEINGHLASFEAIKKFVILPNEFSVESGELTPSMKIRRNVINEQYQSYFNSMYSGPI